ncbi:hypothetical protein AVEN_157182-1 [Araneus ventricosus]|uniref:Uncharacterized protein n=1 Tax=Araneus ventricosus TaxID=182803 RepID=A0A4Y1ZQY6_ARAVE|nr:hypothetical protein AVEN_157182-1 [Araneus ventricosus]
MGAEALRSTQVVLPFSFNEINSFCLSDLFFIKRKEGKELKNSCTQKQHQKSERNWSFPSQSEEKIELGLPQLVHEFICFSGTDLDSSKEVADTGYQ